MSYSNAGVPTLIGPGSTGQVLTSRGAGNPPNMQDAAAGGAALQYQYKTKGSGVNYIISNSSGSSPSTAPFNLITSTFSTGAETSSVWSLFATMSLNDETGTNWNSSMRFFVSYDGGINWIQLYNTGGNTQEGNYLVYSNSGDDYMSIHYRVACTLTPNQSNTKLCAVGFSSEADNTRWNIPDGGGCVFEAIQYKV
jgi:hypothetical protein